MLRPKRKNRLFEYSARHNGWVIFLLTTLFGGGLLLSLRTGLEGVFAYLLLWAASYGVIYAGTCRYCAYYGKKCPIPLEGACVDALFEKKEGRFGWHQLVWATAAYALRVLIPVWIIVKDGLIVWGTVYAGILLLFCIVHLRITGCPNCINTECPLNPGAIADPWNSPLK